MTSIGTILAETLFGLGRCEYHFQVQTPANEIRSIASSPDAISLGWARPKRLHPATLRLNQPGGRQEMFPKISSTNRRSVWASREVDLFSLERSSGVFMRGIRPPHQNLSENFRPARCARCLDAAARRPYHVPVKQPSLLATRRSLVERLADWDDQLRWQEFFDTYSKLIYSAARKSGLTDIEAQEVVQETVITVAKSIDKLKYDPAIGSFKGWLLQITRWRIADQFRKREPGNAKRAPLSDNRTTATVERVPDSGGIDLDALWEMEWKENLFEAAIARVKKQIEPKQFQIFDCYVRKEWPAQKVATRLGVNIGQVYLARHRVGALLKKEIRALEKRGR